MLRHSLNVRRSTAEQKPAALLGDLVSDMGGDRASLAPSEPLPATIGPQALNRAPRNLIDNTVRYSGVANVTLMHEQGMAVISIADKGPGLPDDQIEAVFEPFVRFEGSRNRDTGGRRSGSRNYPDHHSGARWIGHASQLARRGLEAIVRLPIGEV